MEGAGVKVKCLDGFGRTFISTHAISGLYHQGPSHFLFSCMALNDLIRGRQAGDIIDRLSEIWETLFRVLDDIKVRSKRLLFVFFLLCSGLMHVLGF